MALPSSDGSLQRCTIAVVTDSAVAVLFDSCRVRKVDKAQFLKLLLSELNPSTLAVVSSSGDFLRAGFLTDSLDVAPEERVAHSIMPRNGVRQPGAYLFGQRRLGKDNSLLVMCESKPAPLVSPVLFGGNVTEGCQVRIPGQADTFIFLRFVSGRSGTQWRNFAVLGGAGENDGSQLFLSKVTSEEGDLTFVRSLADTILSQERLDAMLAAVPTFLADGTPD